MVPSLRLDHLEGIEHLVNDVLGLWLLLFQRFKRGLGGELLGYGDLVGHHQLNHLLCRCNVVSKLGLGWDLALKRRTDADQANDFSISSG